MCRQGCCRSSRSSRGRRGRRGGRGGALDGLHHRSRAPVGGGCSCKPAVASGLDGRPLQRRGVCSRRSDGRHGIGAAAGGMRGCLAPRRPRVGGRHRGWHRGATCGCSRRRSGGRSRGGPCGHDTYAPTRGASSSSPSGEEPATALGGTLLLLVLLVLVLVLLVLLWLLLRVSAHACGRGRLGSRRRVACAASLGAAAWCGRRGTPNLQRRAGQRQRGLAPPRRRASLRRV